MVAAFGCRSGSPVTHLRQGATMTSTPRRKLRLNRETIRDVTVQPQAALATDPSFSGCMSCQSQYCTSI
jgi:hypothetical protein